MTPVIYNKFNKFILYPDLANKFLFSSYFSIVSPDKFNVYLKYLIINRQTYNPLAIKALLMLNSINAKRSQLKTKLILIRFAKNRSHSIIFLKLSLAELAQTMTHLIKKPASITLATKGLISESKFFVFPGFIKYLQFPSWEHSVILSYNQEKTNNQYFLLFYKTAYFD